MRQLLTWQRISALLVLGLLIAVSWAHASSAQTFSQGYSSDKPLQRGLIVKLKKNDTTKVEAVTVDTASETYGITIGASDASVTLAGSGAQSYVATTGHYDVLVSTQNGGLNPGDYITISAIEGIGAKATENDQVVVGRALTAFDGKANVISSTDITDSQKNKHTVAIGRINVDIVVAKNPLLKATQPNVPQFMQRAAQAVAGKEVSASRIYISILVFCITTAIAASLMYGGIRSGIISIGRNPLPKKSIIRTMFQVIITGLIVFIAGVFGVYLLLKL